MAMRVSDERILDAALSSIRERGIAGSTTREIARLAGVNEVTLFRRFGDKAQLVRAAIHDAMTRLGSGGFEPTDDVRDDLARVVAFYSAAFDPRDGVALIMLTEAARRPDLADVLGEPVALLRQAADLIRHHQRAGALVREPAADAVAALVGPLFYSSLSRTIGPGDRMDSGFESRLVDTFLRGHGRSPG